MPTQGGVLAGWGGLMTTQGGSMREHWTTSSLQERCYGSLGKRCFNLFIDFLIEYSEADSVEKVGCYKWQYGERQKEVLWFISQAPSFYPCPFITSSPWSPHCSVSGHSLLNVLSTKPQNLLPHATSSTCSAAIVFKQPPHRTSSCPI